MEHTTRRELLWKSAIVLGTAASTTVAGAAWALPQESQKSKESKENEKEGDEPEVTATEDLMREHGVIRRALLVYWELAEKIRKSPGSIDAAALHKTAQLFRTFGEDYHERMLEEQHIFPIVQKMKGEAAKYPDILVAQHRIGREITDYTLAVTNSSRISVQHGEPLAKALEGLVRMYENHAAREDTIVFPAWKKNFSNKQLDELSDQFEDIEHKMFGKDGFEDAEKTISGIEATFGFTDISQFNPPAPPNLRG
jgi:hemerythrin-like domain-containing protein